MLAADSIPGFTARRMRALRALYDLRPDPGLPDDMPVTAILREHLETRVGAMS